MNIHEITKTRSSQSHSHMHKRRRKNTKELSSHCVSFSDKCDVRSENERKKCQQRRDDVREGGTENEHKTRQREKNQINHSV